MRYAEALQFIYSRLPMFTRVGAAAYKTGMGNIERFCAALNNPQTQFKAIHIAGTNGKGSSSHMLASVLQEAGYKTGLFTSPHLKDFRERIRINGTPISARALSNFVHAHQETMEQLELSFFEMNVALAFWWFAQQKVDIAVIETGLGGRLDSTNIIDPQLSLITNISFDHTDLLGDTLEKIAFEKAGIIKSARPVIISETQATIKALFEQRAAALGSRIRFADLEVDVKNEGFVGGNVPLLQATISHATHSLKVETPLAGNYQLRNLAGVYASLDELKRLGWAISDAHILKGIRNVKENTGLRGRWDKMGSKPDIYADTGHNEAGIAEVLKMIDRLNFEKLHWVWGMVSDKDYAKILSMLPKTAQYYFCKPNIPRGLDVSVLHEAAQKLRLRGRTYGSVRRALAAARKAATPNDVILIGGSTFVVAEVV